MDLVTGGAGFIGAHLVTRLVHEGRRVRVVDDLSTGMLDRLAPVRGSIDLVTADLATAELASIVAGAERVFHLAAVPSVPRSVRDPLTSHHASATATLRLLLACRDAGAERVVLSSSSSVYGDSEVSPKHEGLATVPLSPYAVAKLAAEGYARVFASLFGLRTVALRYFNVFGPWQDPASAYAAVIPIFITRALRGEPLPVYGDGRQTRDFTFVDNVVEANLRAAAADVPGGRVYNVAGGAPHSLADVVDALSAFAGRELTVEYQPPRPGDILHSHADVSAAARELSWTPGVPFAEGLRRTFEWYRQRR